MERSRSGVACSYRSAISGEDHPTRAITSLVDAPRGGGHRAGLGNDDLAMTKWATTFP